MLVIRVVCENCRKEAHTLSDKGWIKMEPGNNGKYISLMFSNGTKYIDAYSGERVDFCSVACFHQWLVAFYEAARVGEK